MTQSQADLLPETKPHPKEKAKARGKTETERALVNAQEHTPPAAPQSETSALLTMLQKVMTDPGLSPDRIDKAIALYKDMDAFQAKKAFNEAMAAARAEIPPILKNRDVDFTSPKGRTNYRHEDLAGIAKIVDPILGRHGLTYRFRTTSNPNEPIGVTCIVSHRQGYAEENTLSAGRDESGNKNSIQAIGSTVTYLQRYTLKAALGLASAHDDDGRTASKTAPLETITGQQEQELAALMQKAGVEKEIITEHFGVTELSELTPQQHKTAMSKCKKKLEQ